MLVNCADKLGKHMSTPTPATVEREPFATLCLLCLLGRAAGTKSWRQWHDAPNRERRRSGNTSPLNRQSHQGWTLVLKWFVQDFDHEKEFAKLARFQIRTLKTPPSKSAQNIATQVPSSVGMSGACNCAYGTQRTLWHCLLDCWNQLTSAMSLDSLHYIFSLLCAALLQICWRQPEKLASECKLPDPMHVSMANSLASSIKLKINLLSTASFDNTTAFNLFNTGNWVQDRHTARFSLRKQDWTKKQTKSNHEDELVQISAEWHHKDRIAGSNPRSFDSFYSGNQSWSWVPDRLTSWSFYLSVTRTTFWTCCQPTTSGGGQVGSVANTPTLMAQHGTTTRIPRRQRPSVKTAQESESHKIQHRPKKQTVSKSRPPGDDSQTKRHSPNPRERHVSAAWKPNPPMHLASMRQTNQNARIQIQVQTMKL